MFNVNKLMIQRVILVLTIVIMLASGCQAEYDSYNAGVGPKVAVIGDSITFQSSEHIIERLGPDHDLYLNAIIGQEWVSMRYAREGLDTPPDVLVVNLGTNIGEAVTPEQFFATVDEFLAPFPTTTCVVLATLSPLGESKFRAATPEIQDGLIQRADVPLRWDLAVSEHPEFVDSTDGVHPTEAGKVAYADLVSDAVHACLRGV